VNIQDAIARARKEDKRWVYRTLKRRGTFRVSTAKDAAFDSLWWYSLKYDNWQPVSVHDCPLDLLLGDGWIAETRQPIQAELSHEAADGDKPV
jgi:hypothetical protein